MSLKALFAALVVVLFCGFSLYGLVSWHFLDSMRVNGPLYKDVVRGKDLIADILPPPAYIVEANLTAHELQLARTDADKKRLADYLAVLERDFNTRISFWHTEPLTPEADKLMQGELSSSGREFFKQAREQLLPAVQAGNTQASADILRSMQSTYEQHRKAVNTLVNLANASNAELEKSADTSLGHASVVLLSIYALSFLVASLAAAWVARRLLAILGGEPAYAAQIVRKLAEGDLRVDMCAPTGQASLLNDIHDMIQKFSEVLRGIHDTNIKVGQSIFQISTVSREIASVSVEQQREATSVAKATDELRTVSDQVNQLASDAQQNSERVEQLAQAGLVSIGNIQSEMGDVVDQVRTTGTAVETLARSGSEINAIVASIKGIANQTNLLALNAAIEAARAGEQGRGFAVVADEVRALAQRTSDATTCIEQIVTSLNSQLDITMRNMSEVGQVVSHARLRAEENGASIHKMATEALESSRSTRQIASASQQQVEQLLALHGRLDALFGTLRSSESTLGVTQTISQSLHGTVEGMQQKINFFQLDLQHSLSEPEQSKRRHARVQHSLYVSVARPVGTPVIAIAEDFSMGGMRLVCPGSLNAKAGDILDLEIKIPTRQLEGYMERPPIRVQGRIARADESGLRSNKGAHYGIAFLQPDAAVERALREAIDFCAQTASDA